MAYIVTVVYIYIIYRSPPPKKKPGEAAQISSESAAADWGVMRSRAGARARCPSDPGEKARLAVGARHRNMGTEEEPSIY